MDAQLIDRIYECALLPETWPAVLETIASNAEARGGHIFVARPVGPILRWSASPGFQEDMAAYVAGRWALHDRRRDRIGAGLDPGFVTDQDLFTVAEREADLAYRNFYQPRGLGGGAFTHITLPTSDWCIVGVERDAGRGPVERDIVVQLDSLRPHLARSALLSARLNMERARAISETLALIGLPALVFNEHGKVLAVNALIEDLTRHVRWQARDRVCLADPAADALFRDAIASILVEAETSVRSFAVRDEAEAAAMVAHIIPIRGSARDLFTRCAGVLILTPLTTPQAPPVELVQSLFDLTPAEARVARGLAEGGTVDEIAATGSVSRNTVRTHLRGVLEKTGCRRQAELVALLSGLKIA